MERPKNTDTENSYHFQETDSDMEHILQLGVPKGEKKERKETKVENGSS